MELQRGKPFEARIGANESSFGPAPSVIEAMRNEATEVWKYGDPENYALRHAIAAHHGLKAEHIMPGAGVDALLGLIVRQYVQQGDKVINSLGGYPTFTIMSQAMAGSSSPFLIAMTSQTSTPLSMRLQGKNQRSSISPIPTTPWEHGTGPISSPSLSVFRKQHY